MAVDFGLRKMRIYLVGNPDVTIVTDHKPLIPIFRGTRPGSIRSERVILRHQDISYKIVWKPGKSNPADFFSRNPIPLHQLPKEEREQTQEMEKVIYLTLNGDVCQALDPSTISAATRKDKKMQTLKKYIQNGTLGSKRSLDQFAKVFNELTITEGGNILRGSRIVLPKKLLEEGLRLAHGAAHLGSSAMKRRLRSVVWFPSMNQEIDKYVSGCQECQQISEKPSKASQKSLQLPERAWEAVSIDHFGPLRDRSFILVVRCDLSRFPAAAFVPSTSASYTIAALEDIFTNYGFPQRQRSDNGPPFHSTEFKQFCNKYKIKHTFTAPYHPRANPAETFMKTLKKTFQACGRIRKEMRYALQKCLRDYRTTPHVSTGVAPASLMMNNFRSELLITRGSSIVEQRELKRKDRLGKEKRIQAFNAKPKMYPPSMEAGDIILMRNNTPFSKFSPKFLPGKFRVLNREGHATFLIAEVDTNRTFVRHEDDLKKWHPSKFKQGRSPPRANYEASSLGVFAWIGEDRPPHLQIIVDPPGEDQPNPRNKLTDRPIHCEGEISNPPVSPSPSSSSSSSAPLNTTSGSRVADCEVQPLPSKTSLRQYKPTRKEERLLSTMVQRFQRGTRISRAEGFKEPKAKNDRAQSNPAIQQRKSERVIKPPARFEDFVITRPRHSHK